MSKYATKFLRGLWNDRYALAKMYMYFTIWNMVLHYTVIMPMHRMKIQIFESVYCSSLILVFASSISVFFSSAFTRLALDLTKSSILFLHSASEARASVSCWRFDTHLSNDVFFFLSRSRSSYTAFRFVAPVVSAAAFFLIIKVTLIPWVGMLAVVQHLRVDTISDQDIKMLQTIIH